MKVLVIDDDQVSRMALAHLIRDLGYQDIVEYDSAEVAWQAIHDGVTPLLCCCDIRMKGVSGLQFLGMLTESEILNEVPCVIVSSVADRETVQSCAQLGAAGYILKPFVFGVSGKIESILQTTWAKYAETPQQTMRRLNIGPDRLQAYLRAFMTEVTSVSELCCERREHGSTFPKERFDRLRTGCLTLGLWRSSRIIDAIGTPKKEAQSILLGLDYVKAVAEHQLKIIKN